MNLKFPFLSFLALSLPACAQQTPVANIAPLPMAEQKAGLLDALYLGADDSENAHALVAQNSDIVSGLLGEKARRLLPLAPLSWQGGTLEFTLKTDPQKPNYLTLKLSGDDITESRLVLFADGKQVGLKHLGDVDLLDIGTPSPFFKGRFYANTTPLPLALTQGKSQVRFQIRSLGRIWAYGTTFDKFQYNLDAPTRGIYAVYSGTSGFFTSPAREKQGATPATPPLRTAPGPEVLEEVKARVSKETNGLMNGTKPLTQMQMLFLARAYGQKETPAFGNPKAIARILEGMDAYFVALRQNPKLAQDDRTTYNADWFGFGPMGWAFSTVRDQIKPVLDAEIADEKGGKIRRRNAYAEMFFAAREWHRKHRRLYTNQTMIKDLYGIYLDNRGLQLVGSDAAWPEAQALRYLREAMGLEPWRNHDPDSDQKPWPVAPGYLQLTAKGLTKELGYVGSYGEVLDWASQIYAATQTPDNPAGDAPIRDQLVKIARARANFRAPALDDEGFRAMRLETVVGWRDTHYPGEVTYAQRAHRDSTPFEVAVLTRDPQLVGAVQQMMADNQLYASLREMMEEGGFRVTFTLLSLAPQLETLQTLPASPYRLPMAPQSPDRVFSDEEDGVVAIKNGDDVLYASLYWRARFGLNGLARVHYTTPTLDRIATVREEFEFTPSGLTFKRNGNTTATVQGMGQEFQGAGEYGKTPSALEGEEMPIAKVPAEVPFKAGDESVYAGKADFYTLRYGPYLIAMNTTADKTFAVKAPANATDVATKKPVKVGQSLQVGARSTVVLYLGSN